MRQVLQIQIQHEVPLEVVRSEEIRMRIVQEEVHLQIRLQKAHVAVSRDHR